MIKHFSVLYVGHIELDHVGRDGTPIEHLRKRFGQRSIDYGRSR